MKQRLNDIASMYIDGFRSMTIGRKLWLLIIIKLFIFFAVLKLFFFPDILNTRYTTDSERARAVGEALTTAIENDTTNLNLH